MYLDPYQIVLERREAHPQWTVLLCGLCFSVDCVSVLLCVLCFSVVWIVFQCGLCFSVVVMLSCVTCFLSVMFSALSGPRALIVGWYAGRLVTTNTTRCSALQTP